MTFSLSNALCDYRSSLVAYADDANVVCADEDLLSLSHRLRTTMTANSLYPDQEAEKEQNDKDLSLLCQMVLWV